MTKIAKRIRCGTPRRDHLDGYRRKVRGGGIGCYNLDSRVAKYLFAGQGKVK